MNLRSVRNQPTEVSRKALRRVLVVVTSLSLFAGLLVMGSASAAGTTTSTVAASIGESAKATATSTAVPTTRAATKKSSPVVKKNVLARFRTNTAKLSPASKTRIRKAVKYVNGINTQAQKQSLALWVRATSPCRNSSQSTRRSCSWSSLAKKRSKELKRFVRAVGYRGKMTTKQVRPSRSRAKALSPQISVLRFTVAETVLSSQSDVYNIKYVAPAGSWVDGCKPKTYTSSSPTFTPDKDTCFIKNPPPMQEFDYWTPASIPAGSTGDVTFTAHWKYLDYNISWNANGGEISGCSPTTYSVNSDTITPTEESCERVIAPAGKKFAGWSPAQIYKGESGHKTFTAQWEDLNCAEGGPCKRGDVGPGGGNVFYVDNDGFGPDKKWKYLEAAQTPIAGSYAWGCDGINVAGTQKAMGTGGANTATLTSDSNVIQCEEGKEQTDPGALPRAAMTASNYDGNGETDWFLPSVDELNQLCRYLRGATTGPGPIDQENCYQTEQLAHGTYWTSTQGDSPNQATTALAINFDNTTLYTRSKSEADGVAVWPIRGFAPKTYN